MVIYSNAALLLLCCIHRASAVSSNQTRVASTGMPVYNLSDRIAHNLGVYSARYPLTHFGHYTSIKSDLPDGCQVTQVNILQRHAARYPTAGHSLTIASAVKKTMDAVRTNPDAITGTPLDFLNEYEYRLGTEQLVDFGRQQAYTTGQHTAAEYADILDGGVFVRSTAKDRVLESSRWFKHGLQGGGFPALKSELPLPDVIIPLGPSSNNTLSIENCKAAEVPRHGLSPKLQWADIFAAPIAARLNAFVPGLNLSVTDTVALMSLCGFDTAFAEGKPSPWCRIASKSEWEQYEYYHDLERYWEDAYGSPFSRAQGSGWVNELIARLTGTPVHVSGSVNGTLDSDPRTFPIPPQAPCIFADFSSDTNIAHIISALGLLWDQDQPSPQGPPIPGRLLVASEWVPFSTRLVVEKLACGSVPLYNGPEKEGQSLDSHNGVYVRVILNDAVVPMIFESCGSDGVSTGLCSLDGFVHCEPHGWESSPPQVP